MMETSRTRNVVIENKVIVLVVVMVFFTSGVVVISEGNGRSCGFING